jgi:hypothetical protein
VSRNPSSQPSRASSSPSVTLGLLRNPRPRHPQRSTRPHSTVHRADLHRRLQPIPLHLDHRSPRLHARRRRRGDRHRRRHPTARRGQEPRARVGALGPRRLRRFCKGVGGGTRGRRRGAQEQTCAQGIRDDREVRRGHQWVLPRAVRGCCWRRKGRYWSGAEIGTAIRGKSSPKARTGLRHRGRIAVQR